MTIHEMRTATATTRHSEVPATTRHRRRTGPVIVVGIDGSASARNAAMWAASEALRRHASLRLIHAYWVPAAGYSGYNPYPADMLTTMRDDGEQILEEISTALQTMFPGLDVSAELVHADAAAALRRAAGDAVLTVVGGHHRSRVATALGSLAAKLIGRNPSPVAVVPGGEAPVSGPVVVGVDGSPASEGAIAFAFEEASLRQCALTAVHCWTDQAMLGQVAAYASVLTDPDPIQESERALLSERLAGWTERYPEVAVEQVLTHHSAALALGDRAAAAQLLVLGTRGHAGIAGLLAGSTGQTLIGHSPVPVVVVHPPQ